MRFLDRITTKLFTQGDQLSVKLLFECRPFYMIVLAPDSPPPTTLVIINIKITDSIRQGNVNRPTDVNSSFTILEAEHKKDPLKKLRRKSVYVFHNLHVYHIWKKKTFTPALFLKESCGLE